MESILLSGEPDGHEECGHWLGIKFAGLDCEGWLRFMEAESVDMDPRRKVTVPLVTHSVSLKLAPVVVYNVATTEADGYDCYGNTVWPTYLWERQVGGQGEEVV